MQDLNEKINNWFKKITTKEPIYEKKSFKPKRDWGMILTITQLVIILCAIWAFRFYSQVDSGTLFQLNPDNFQKEVKININLLDKTVKDINLREENFEKARLGLTTPDDPSR